MLDKVAHITTAWQRQGWLGGGADAVRSGEFVCLPPVSAYDGNTRYFVICL